MQDCLSTCMVNKELIKGSSDIAILSVLATGPLYGYEIAKQIRERSQSILQLGEGTLYPVLHKLEAAKLLTSYWEQVGGRKRKYYRITRRGHGVLSDKVSEWQTFTAAVNATIAK